MASSQLAEGRTIRRADPSTIQDKFLVGYQGWFTCAGDGKPLDPHHHGWLHWFDAPLPSGGHIHTDLWPDLSEYSPSELYPAPGMKYANGEQVSLFSSRNPKTVQRHFHWMATNGVDGAFLQRFVGQVRQSDENMRNQRDEIGDVVRAAAEKEGRVFAIMYDVAGLAPGDIQKIIEDDWVHVIRNKRVLESPNYLKEKGKPVVVLWGFGLSNQNHNPATVRAITSYIRRVTPGGAYIMAGVAAHWRTSVSDADPNPEFVDVWLNEFDAISPWTIGRYGDEGGADHFAAHNIKGDVELINRRNQEGTHRKIDYVPVVLPGGSGYNTSGGHWGFNNIKRNGGRFLWRQIYNVRHLGVKTIYGAMWDEYDEGTAYLPVVSHKRQLPILEGTRFMALDEDGYDLPPDWYMRICGYAAEILKGERVVQETFPVKELQDFWSTRPRYEDEASASGSGSSSGFGAGGQGQTYQEWLAAQGEEKEDVPPPPYSLEAGAEPPAPRVPLSTRPLSTHGSPPVNPASRPQGPPPVDSNSRPQVGSSSGQGHPPTSPSARYGMSSLSQDFGRQSISPRPTGPAPPPLHPSRPSPQSQSGPQGPWAQGQWPPTEWNANHAQQQPGPWSGQGRPGQHQSPAPPPLRPRPSGSGTPPHPPTPHGHSAPPQSPPPKTPSPSSYGPPSGYGPSFPQVHTDEGEFHNMPTPQQQQQYSYPVYSGGSHTPPFNPHQFPQPHGAPPVCSAPPVPPRPYGPPPAQPGNYGPPPPPPAHYASFSAGPPPPSSNSGGPLGFALNAVDRVAGQDRRRQLERGVGSLTQSGSKLFNKFTK